MRWIERKEPWSIKKKKENMKSFSYENMKGMLKRLLTIVVK